MADSEAYRSLATNDGRATGTAVGPGRPLRSVSFARDERRGLPGLFTTGYNRDLLDHSGLAEPLPDGPTARCLATAAGAADISVAGSILERAGGADFDTAVVFDARGSLVARHRKTHPRGDPVFGQGDELRVEALDSLRLGLAICFEHALPEIFAELALGRVIGSRPERFTTLWRVALFHVRSRRARRRQPTEVGPPAEGRDHPPAEGRDHPPAEGRDRAPTEGRDRARRLGQVDPHLPSRGAVCVTAARGLAEPEETVTPAPLRRWG